MVTNLFVRFGDARLKEGERVLAFVRERNDQWYFTALGQSVWHVVPEGLYRDVDASHLMERGYDGRITESTQSPLPFETVDQLTTTVEPLPFGGAL